MTTERSTGLDGLLPYVPALLRTWSPTGDDPRHMRVRGSLAFVDISGFTRLTERLARKGNVGAEEMSDLLSSTFADLLTVARDDAADLVKWGGDAVLLLFQGSDHAARAARSAYRMRAALRDIGRIDTSSGIVTLRMSVGVHSGDFDFFLVGDPSIHQELLISGTGASVTAQMEAAAAAGQIGLSSATAALLEPRQLGPPLLDGRLLRSAPLLPNVPLVPWPTLRTDPARMLPPPIRTHLLAGSVEPEHRLITVAFVQFTGTDALLESAGPGALAQALDEVVRNVQQACGDHDVTFFESDINSDGGKIMLTAGAPRSADHDEERMLRVARMILDRAGTLPLRIGINRGHVFAGDFGPAFRRTYSVKGDAINLAARVMGKAPPGQALATIPVVSHSQTLFETRELPAFLVKGKAHPVRAAVIGLIVGTRDQARSTAPLVGRSDSMAVLAAALSEACTGHGRLVEVVGEAGIGKSRLVTELLSDIDGVRVVRAACEQYESSTAYYPFRRLLSDVLGALDEEAPADIAARLIDLCTANAPHLVPWLPLLAAPLDLRLAPTRETAELDDRFRKTRLEAVLVELIGTLLPSPTVLWIEDAHLMDDASAELLQQLADSLDAQPWLVLVTRREHPAGFAAQQSVQVTSLSLSRLDSGEALELVEAALEEHLLPPQALAALAARGGGNPMFLKALAIEAGRVGAVAHLPESVEALVTSQIDRLDVADRTVLRYAAVLGVTVDETALDVLLEDHNATAPPGALGRLGDFLDRESPDQLRFRNSLLRDVAYEGLPFRLRKTLHDWVGQTIERSAPSPESQCELLSLHFFHAGRHELAWHYSVLAGNRALAKFAHGEAIDFFARAAQSSMGHAGLDPIEVARVLEKLADSQFLIGLSHEASDAYAQARWQLRGDPVRLAGIIEKEARIDDRRRKFSQAMRRISRGLKALEGIQGRPADVARSLLARRYAYSRFSQGRIDEALLWADRAAQAAEDAVDKDALAQAYEMLNAIYAGSGRPEPLPYGRLALQAYTELDNLPWQGHCLNNLAVQAFTAGRWEEALTSYQRATDIFRRIGDTAGECNAMFNQAELLMCQRRNDEAAQLLPEVLRVARAIQDDELVALVQREQAKAFAATGNLEGARDLLHRARDRFAELREPAEVLATDVVLAEVLLDADHLEEAGTALGYVVEASGGIAGVGVAAHRLIGRQYMAEGRHDEAKLMLVASLEEASRQSNQYEEALILLELDALERSTGVPNNGHRHRARQILDAMGVISGAERRKDLGISER